MHRINTADGGWFDLDAAELVHTEGQEWDGQNMKGRTSGMQTTRAQLWRTAGGRWVHHVDGTGEHGGADRWRFMTDGDVRAFLVSDEEHDLAERLVGDVPPERGPGRPEIGGAVHVRLGETVLRAVDERADGLGWTRAETIRALIVDGLNADRGHPGG